MTVADNVARVRERMAAACARAGRPAEAARLMAVTKTVPAARIREAIAAGITLLGENRVQEMELKRRELGQPPAGAAALEWHLIGHLQSNKAARAVALFDVFQALDGASLAARLDRLGATAGRRLPVMVEVNIGREAQKTGVMPEALGDLAEAVMGAPHLHWIGLMAIPPGAADPELSRPHFAALRRLWENLGRQALGRWELSMGMSHDFEVAIEEGATMVRVGTAIFGTRPGH